MRKQCLEFVLPNPGEICKHLAGAYNSNNHTRRLLLSYFCMTLLPKNHNLFYEGKEGLKKGWGEKGKSTSLYGKSIIHGGWGVKRDGRVGRLLYTHEPGDM
jgi:hypothetical protein